MARDTSLDEFVVDDESDDDGASGETTEAVASEQAQEDLASGEATEEGAPEEAPEEGASGEATDDRSRGPEDEDGGAPAGSEAVDPSEVDPAASTAVWTPGGTCGECGEAAERRWRQAGTLVCDECKRWSEG